MNIHDEFKQILSRYIENNPNSDCVQYHHRGSCLHPCDDCPQNNKHIFENKQDKPKVGIANHPHCDCYYEAIETIPVGKISNKGFQSPDVYLKAWGKLPDYYITKEEAIKLGWQPGKNLNHFAPGKMLGGNVYKNRFNILPVKEGRKWYECDIDYVPPKRNNLRLYYSNDGLMFYSSTHDDRDVVFIK